MRKSSPLAFGALFAAALLSAAPSAGWAQGPMRDSLQARVMEQFLQNYRQTAQLTDEQFIKTQDALRQSFAAHQTLQQRERDLWEGLQGQLRPGVAANSDSVTKLLDGLLAVQSDRVAQGRRDQQAFSAFLTPVQRALLTVHLRQLQMRVQRMMEGRGRPGMRPEL